MHPSWFKTRRYRHFDVPVGASFLSNASNEVFVSKHSWLPLIHYIKRQKRYKPKDNKTVYKDRDIMFAGHRDACILSKYAHDLNQLLEVFYKTSTLNNSVVAYRKLGRANHDFSAEAATFARSISPCRVLCFDISGFFDHLDHGILKARLRNILNVAEIPKHWYSVFRAVTRYSKVDLKDLLDHPVIGRKMRDRSKPLIAPVSEVVSSGIPIHKNPNSYGVPQGSPISSTFSNLYMIDLDVVMTKICAEAGARYLRYSDDILIICPSEVEGILTSALQAEVAFHKLELKAEKCEQITFDASLPTTFQYLGFDVSYDEALIRASSLSRQWRKLRRNIAHAERLKIRLSEAGAGEKIYTRKLRRKFSPLGIRNFSLYARHAANSLQSKQVVKQVRRLEQFADRKIRALNKADAPETK